MIDSALTLGRIFSFPRDGVQAGSPAQWDLLEERIAEDVKTIQWTGAIPDISRKVKELFDIEIPDVLVASWTKAQALQSVLEESKNAPEEILYLELADHTISSEHHPYVEIRIKNVPARKIEFTVQLIFTLKGFILKIQGGMIREIQTGKCEVEGTVQYEGVTIAEKKLETIKLPGSIPI